MTKMSEDLRKLLSLLFVSMLVNCTQCAAVYEIKSDVDQVKYDLRSINVTLEKSNEKLERLEKRSR